MDFKPHPRELGLNPRSRLIVSSPDRPEPPDMDRAESLAAPPDPDFTPHLSPCASPAAAAAPDLRCVVVAEDDEGLCRIVCRRLERHGLTTLGVHTGAEAIAAVQEHPDCLLLLDYLLPDVDGRQFLDKLRTLGVAVPFVVMTGHGDERIAVEMMKLGARDYIVKQVDFTDLLVPVVERVLAQVATEQRLTRAEQALRDSEVKYRVLMDDAPDAILLADERGQIVEANRQAERLLGRPRADIAGLHVSALYPGGALTDVSPRLADLVLNGRCSVSDTLVVRGDGSRVPVDVTASLVTYGGREVSQIVLHDITERKRAEEELRTAFTEIRVLKEQLEAENVYLREEVKLSHVHGDIVGESPAIKQTLALAEQVAPTDSTVLIYGETGTGKELLARSIHNLSPRKDRPLVTVNCAAMPSTLIEAELFGREKGAYTGALTRQVGRFEVADQGTLFLDEVGELSPEAQAKLLRVLQEGKFERLGSSSTITVDVRVIAATNRNLERAVETGRFREDLFYRLNVFPITIPPLRERREDIPLLIWTFVREFSEKMGKRIDNIPRTTIDALSNSSWPGNVRALRNTIERAMILSTGTTLNVDLADASAGARAPTASDDAERGRITRALETAGWRIRGTGGAAELLGVKPTTLEYRIKRLGIKRRPED
ncbi:sigma 54-interacting transcriptional regulator [candidate division WOR-3 bacterium]|nr:sigma 54-interacting transcriptional regulator [candidate division WOR-3 bacterium]